MYIKAPYNFVPLNKKVVIPEWGNNISHDVPFSDGLSGSMEVQIKAHSDIFVRDELKETETGAVGKFSNFDNRYFIPGTSLKGMIRNVVEIMSFCKLKDKVNPHRYAIRDLARSAKEIYMDNFKAKEISGGWLSKRPDGTYVIEDCGKPGRISHRVLDQYFSTNFSTFFSDRGRFNQRKDEQKAAQFKYELFKGKPRSNRFTEVGDSAGRILFEPSEKGEQPGTIVFTGQPGPRMKARNGRWTGHHLEFIFFNKKREVTVKEEVMQNFFFAFYEHDKNQWSIDWKHWRQLLNKGEQIPVFFRSEGGSVTDLGLSFLYKLPYKNAIDEAIAKFQEKEGIDLSQAIFGYTNEQEGSQSEDSLKGRVHIGHAFAKADTIKVAPTTTELLSSPKASYYPNYIRQKIKNGKVQGRFQTLMDPKPEIAGWKRYPIHPNGVKSNLMEKDYKAFEKVSTSFTPLKKGAAFTFTIRFHNLKMIELGALLSALTFHQTQDTFHSIGMAKPLGYGKISLDIQQFKAEKVLPNSEGKRLPVTETDCLKTYEAYMNVALGNQSAEWHQTQQLTDLVTMVSEQKDAAAPELEYMKIGIGRGERNGFVEAKKAFEGLDRYSKLKGIKTVQVQSLISMEDLTAMKTQVSAMTYGQQLTPKQGIEKFKKEKTAVLELLFEQKKQAVLKKLQEARIAMKAEELKRAEEEKAAAIAARKEERMAAAQSSKPTIEAVDPKHKKAFEIIKKEMSIYLERFHGKKYKTLQEEFPEGSILAEEYHDLVIQKVNEIYEHSNKKDKGKWKKDFARNANLKKVGEWIGIEKAKSILNT